MENRNTTSPAVRRCTCFVVIAKAQVLQGYGALQYSSRDSHHISRETSIMYGSINVDCKLHTQFHGHQQTHSSAIASSKMKKASVKQSVQVTLIFCECQSAVCLHALNWVYMSQLVHQCVRITIHSNVLELDVFLYGVIALKDWNHHRAAETVN